MVAGSTALKIAYTPGSRPVGSDVILGSSGTRWNTKWLGHSKGPSPQSRAGVEGVVGDQIADLALPGERHPAVDRASERDPEVLVRRAELEVAPEHVDVPVRLDGDVASLPGPPSV